jgi:hypothetical protein
VVGVSAERRVTAARRLGRAGGAVPALWQNRRGPPARRSVGGVGPGAPGRRREGATGRRARRAAARALRRTGTGGGHAPCDLCGGLGEASASAIAEWERAAEQPPMLELAVERAKRRPPRRLRLRRRYSSDPSTHRSHHGRADLRRVPGPRNRSSAPANSMANRSPLPTRHALLAALGHGHGALTFVGDRWADHGSTVTRSESVGIASEPVAALGRARRPPQVRPRLSLRRERSPVPDAAATVNLRGRRPPSSRLTSVGRRLPTVTRRHHVIQRLPTQLQSGRAAKRRRRRTMTRRSDHRRRRLTTDATTRAHSFIGGGDVLSR